MSADVGGRGIIICKLYARYFVSRSVKVTELTVSFLPDYTHTQICPTMALSMTRRKKE